MQDKDITKEMISRTEELAATGWAKEPVGFYRSSGVTKEIGGFELWVRRTGFDDFLKKSSFERAEESRETRKDCGFPDMGSSTAMGSPKPTLTPTPERSEGCEIRSLRNSESLPELGRFTSFASLRAIRPNRPCILIAYDSEWNASETSREMLSWQFAVVWDGMLYEFVFLKSCQDDLSIDLALGVILDKLGVPSVDIRSIRRYTYCHDWDAEDKPVETITSDLDEARHHSIYVYREGSFTHEIIKEMPDWKSTRSERDWAYFHLWYDYKAVEPVPITLVCHAGKGDISGLALGQERSIINRLTEVQGGLVSLNPIRLHPRSCAKVTNEHVFPVSLSVADTMCHAPAGMKKLEDLGNAVGIRKVDIPIEQKADMKSLLESDPCLYMEYASTDSVVTLMYASALYGYNNSLPVTITSATAGVMKASMMGYLGCSSVTEFNRIYRGLESRGHGMVPRDDCPGYVEVTSLEPISDSVNTIQNFSSLAYHGGYNGCSEVGYFPFKTYDYDLQNAYPTAMCLVPDIDYSQPVRAEIIRRNLEIADFAGIEGVNPFTPFVGYVRFKFPQNVKFPCIPIDVDGVPVYPRTSDGVDGVYAAGPAIFLALRLGATVFCERGYFLKTIINPRTLKESRCLSAAVKALVEDRGKAKRECGKKSLEELILKTMVNSGYGKNAQNVVKKSSWSAYKDAMESLGCSAITNPVSAMMITSIVQAELLAAQNQMSELGYVSCSVTTDGFISNCPEETLKTLDLYGIRQFIEQSRLFLTGDPELWEVKHHQDDLVNFTTRGNVSLRCKSVDGYDGVCAHNSTKSGYESDSYEDRLWLMKQVLTRKEAVSYTDSLWPLFKDLAHGKNFVIKSVTRKVRMDFDLKRKPDRTSFKTDRPVIDGTSYEIAHFDTVPFENIGEFKLYRKNKDLVKVLRTEADWKGFWEKIDLKDSKAVIKDLDWSILHSCIMGYRLGLWDVPALHTGSVSEKCEWINRHNESKKVFTENDWKNCRRPQRVSSILPKETLLPKLMELQNDVIENQ